jgi:hypothetical protein
MLTRINNEAKVRQLTKLLVLRQAKVISFKDIEVARVARATKDVIKGKGKRSRKRKSATLEANKPKLEPELKPELNSEPEVARATKKVINGKGKRGRKRKSATQEAEELELEAARIIDTLVL